MDKEQSLKEVDIVESASSEVNLCLNIRDEWEN